MFRQLHLPLSTTMTDLDPVKRVEMAPDKASISTELELPVVKVEEFNSNSEITSLRIPAGQPDEKPKEKVCGVCNNHEAKYKCSRCQLP